MTDITERLRDAARIHVEIAGQSALAATINAGADEIDRLRARVAELEAADGICFTAMLVEIDGHAYGLRPGALRLNRQLCSTAAKGKKMGEYMAAQMDRQIEGAISENEQLRRDLEIALDMLAQWCVAVNVNGTGWDDWDEYYKDAAYRPGPLREQLDAAIAEVRKQRQ